MVLCCTNTRGFWFLHLRYGLGMIFYKKEKFTLAEAHFKKALAINPQSAVLLCHIGLVSSMSLRQHSTQYYAIKQCYHHQYSFV